MITYIVELAAGGGPVMWALIIMMALVILVVCERFYFYHHGQINARDFMAGVMNNLRKVTEGHQRTQSAQSADYNRRSAFLECVRICEDTPGFVPRVAKAAVMHATHSTVDLERAVQEEGRAQLALLERRLGFLATCGKVANLFGLLGTMYQLIAAFKTVGEKGSVVNISHLAPLIGQALMVAAVGLLVSIISYVFYNHFVSRVKAIAAEMEQVGDEMIHYLSHNRLDVEVPARSL